MEKVEVKIYRFKELSDEAQAKALEHFRYVETEWDWWDMLDCLLDLNAEEFKSRRIPLKTCPCPLISYDIEAFDLDRGQYLTFKKESIEIHDQDIFRKFLRIPKYLWENIHYYFTNPYGEVNTKIEFEHQAGGSFTPAQEEILERASEIWDGKVFEAWKMLCAEYESRLSDEYVKDWLENNEKDFREDGSVWNG